MNMLLVPICCPKKQVSPEIGFMNPSDIGHWELDAATAEFLEPTAKKAAAPEGLVPVYSQR